MAHVQAVVMVLFMLVDLQLQKLHLRFEHLLTKHFFPQLPQILIPLVNATLQLGIELLTHLVELVPLLG